MSLLAAEPVLNECSEAVELDASVLEAVRLEAVEGLSAQPRSLAPWLFYDAAGSALFEQITQLPEYYLTRTERDLFAAHADEIVRLAAQGQCLTLVELGAGTATKTGILLEAAVRLQGSVRYHPIDVSATALQIARENIEQNIQNVVVEAKVANYIADPLVLNSQHGTRTLALYIGSSIGNFSPREARQILANLRSQLRPGDSLLLGTDLAPGPNKPLAAILAAYDDADQVTATFNRNLLIRLNRELGADFRPETFRHVARWNEDESRIEMHLESLLPQTVHLPATTSGDPLAFHFLEGETIHTENSYKFTPDMIEALLSDSGFQQSSVCTDKDALFAVTLAAAM